MKLIYLHQYFKKPSMSGGVRSYEFAKRLIRDGHQVVLITADTENTFKSWKIENIDGLEVHWISVKYNNSYGFLQRIIAFLKFMFLATFHILKIDCDKVLATSTPLTIVIPALTYKLIRKKNFIFEVRDVWPEVPIALGVLKSPLLIRPAYFLEKIAYKYAEHIIALSPDMGKSVRKRCAKTSVTIVPNAADCHLFNNVADCNEFFLESLDTIKEKHSYVVFYTGALGLVNNLSYLIDLSKFSSGSVGFVIIGSGKERAELERYAKECDTLNRTLHFLPNVSKEQLSYIHQKFDIATSTVLPIKELFANSANKVFDAFAAGSPLLINHGGWLKDVVESNRCGLVLKEQASIDEFNKLYSFLSNEEVYNSACSASKLLGENDFNREVLYEDFRKVIES